MDFVKLKSMLEEQQENPEATATGTPSRAPAIEAAPEAVKSDTIPPTMDPAIAAQMKQDMVARDAERARLGVKPFQGLRDRFSPADAPNPTAHWTPGEVPVSNKDTDPLEKQLAQERLAKALEEHPEMAAQLMKAKEESSKLAGQKVEARAQEAAQDEMMNMSPAQRLLKGGTPGMVDLAKQK